MHPHAHAAAEAPPDVVTLHLWRIRARHLPAAVGRVALDRHRVRRMPGVTFAKVVGTGTGHTFGPGDVEPRRWAMVVAWRDRERARQFDRSPLARGWARLSVETCRLDLRPIGATGRWSGRAPFGGPTTGGPTTGWTGPVAALTRARLTVRRMPTFWRAIPGVVAELAGRPGLRLAFGFGEAPVLLPGTFSVWDRAAALRAFAYTPGTSHAQVIDRTDREGWYREQLFARFVVLDARGTVDGQAVLA